MPAHPPDPGLPRCALPKQGRRRVETGGVPSGADGATNNKEAKSVHTVELVRRPGPR